MIVRERGTSKLPGDDLVRTWAEGPAAIVQLNRPAVHNAINAEMLAVLHEALRTADAEVDVRAVVLTGAGKSFCSGDDLKDARDSAPDAFANIIHALQQLTRDILACSKPVICAFNGPAYGAGLELTLACDLRLATPDFACATPEVHLGLLATNGASILLPQLIGPAEARRLLLCGKKMDAAQSLACGLVDEIIPAEALLPRAVSRAGEIAKGGPAAIAATRAMLNAPMREALAEALEREAALCVRARATAEAHEGLDAFLSKRPAPWHRER